MDTKVKHFFGDPKWYKNKIMTNILWYIDSKGVYAQKLLRTTIMSRGDAIYILPYETHIEVVTNAQMGLNHSVYVVLWLKTKFDGHIWGFVTFFLLDNLKCPGVTQNHEIINWVKPCHILAIIGSEMSVVAIYAHKISHIRITNCFAISFKVFWKCPRVTQCDELISQILLSWS